MIVFKSVYFSFIDMKNINSSSIRRRSRMFISVVLSIMLILILGSTATWGSPMLKKLNSTEDNPLGRRIRDDENSWLASIAIPGLVVGSMTMGSIINKFGRKTLLTILGIPTLAFFLIMAVSKSIYWFYIAKMFDGVALGGCMTLLPMYICELADPEVRGMLCSAICIAVATGSLLTYCLGPLLSFCTFHMVFSIFPVIFIVLFLIFGLESPYYYIDKDIAKAEELLRELRGVQDVSEEIRDMKRSLDKSSDASVLDVLKSKAARKALCLGLVLNTFFILTGTLVFNSYTEYIFDTAGGHWSGEVDTIVLGVFQLLTAIVATSVIDRFNRKNLLFFSYIGIGLSLFTIGLYFFLKSHGVDLSCFGWLPLLSLIGYSISFGFGPGPLTHTIMGEIFPLKLKGIGNAIVQIYTLGLAFLLTYLFISIEKTIGLGGTFWLFAGSCFCATVFVRIFVIETKGKTLNEVQAQLGRDEKKVEDV